MLSPFIPKGLTITVNLAKVEAENCPYKGREIVVYSAETMEEIIRAYALAFAHDQLQKNQLHIGKQASTLLAILVKTAMHTIIEEACGLTPQIQKTVQRYYRDTIFAKANDFLYYFLRVPYPDRETKKYQYLMATGFKYAYEEFIGKEQYKKIKAEKKSYPVHQYIKDDVTRRRCVCYMLLLSNYLATFGCPIAQAKEPVGKLVQRLIALESPGLVPKTSPLQEVFAFMKEDEVEEPVQPELKAIYYGEVQVGSELKGDGYILEDGSPGMSENGVAILLDMNQKSLNTLSQKRLPQQLQQFMEKGGQLHVFPVKVVAKNSPYQGRWINFYSVESLELLIRVYASALVAGALKKTQEHIGKRSIVVQSILVRTAIAALIRESCGLTVNMQRTVAKHFQKDSLVEEREILMGALQLCYPKFSAKKRQALLAKGFRFGYEDSLSKEEYAKIRGQGYPLHKHITEEETLARFSQYLLLLAGQMMVREWNIIKARDETRKLWQKLGEMKKSAPGFTG
jgi:hypothetical protein